MQFNINFFDEWKSKKKILIFYKQFKADAVFKTNEKNIKPKYFC